MNKKFLVLSAFVCLSLMMTSMMVSATPMKYTSGNLLNQTNSVKGSLFATSSLDAKWVYNPLWGVNVKTYYWKDNIYGKGSGLTPGVSYTVISDSSLGISCLGSATANSYGVASFNTGWAEGTWNNNVLDYIYVVKSTDADCNAHTYSNPVLHLANAI